MSHDEREGEGRGRLDVEAAFADIVAHWDDSARTPVGSWPAQEDLDEAAPEAEDGGVHADPARPSDLTEAAPSAPAPAGEATAVTDDPHPLLTPAGWSPTEELPSVGGTDDPDADRFVPPDPPPLPRGDAVGWLAWTAVLGGPAFLLLASLLWSTVGRLWILLAVVAFIAGFATLVARLPNGRSDDDPDNGAVV